MNKNINDISILTLYLSEANKYPRLTHKQLLEEYENINLKEQLLIIENGIINAEKLFDLISCKEDFVLVENYININCINKYPQTKEDKELISMLDNYDFIYNEKKVDIKNQLSMYNKYMKSRENVINSNLRLVVSIAKSYTQICELSDAISAGNEGLIKATDKFDSKLNYQFSTYATFWIKQTIINMVNNSINLIKVPKRTRVDNLKITKKLEELNMKKGFILSEEELAKELGISDKEMKKYFEYINAGNILSINRELNEDGETLETYLEDESNPYDDVINYDNDTVNELLDILTDKERYVIENRLGLTTKKMSLRELAVELKMTHQGVRAIETKSIKKLKKYAIKNRIR